MKVCYFNDRNKKIRSFRTIVADVMKLGTYVAYCLLKIFYKREQHNDVIGIRNDVISLDLCLQICSLIYP